MKTGIYHYHTERQLQAMFLYLVTINVINFWAYILYNAGVGKILQYIDSLTLFLILYIWMVPALYYLSHKMKRIILWYVSFLLIFFLISCFRQECLWGMQYNNYALWIWGTSIPCVLLTCYVPMTKEFNDRLLRYMRIVGLIVVLIYVLSTYVIANRLTPEYYMFFSSGAAIVATSLTAFALERKKPVDIVLAIILSMLILSGGARSNFIQIFAVVCIYFILRKKSWKVIMALMAIMVLYILAQFYAEKLLLLTNFGQSRTLRFLLSNNFMETDRMIIYKQTIGYLNEQSMSVQLFGLGLGGERHFISSHLTVVGYVHQMFIEMILQFGYVGGSIIIMLFLFISLFTVIQIRKTQQYVLLASVLIAMLVPLLVSGSYIASSSFHLWMGFCLRTIDEYRKSKRLIAVNFV